MDNDRTFVHRGIRASLPAPLRWVPALLLLVALLTTALVACGGDGGGSSEQPSREEAATGTPEPTPTLERRGGAELTVEEYAEAMEEIAAAREEEIEGVAAGIMSGSLFSGETVGRLSALETNESWSQEDVEFATGFARTMLEATTGLYDTLLGISTDSIDEMSGLVPPEHLSGLHGDLIATYREILQLTQDFVETVGGADTGIENREELADFMEVVNSLESGPSNPDLMERVEGVCLALTRQLESELERDVNFCAIGEQGASSSEPDTAPAPTAAAAAPVPTAAAAAPAPTPGSTSAETDREALIALYNATDGPNWTNNDNWLSDRPLGEWYGVEIENGRVVFLDLMDNGLRGHMPAEVGQLSYLFVLWLSINDLSGVIPAELGQLSYLSTLAIDSNDLSGEIPIELGQLSNLFVLYLGGNDLSGEIPAELGQLSYLEVLELAGNDLSGEIPAELGQLSNLKELYLWANALSGQIPAELGQLSNLEVLELSDNALSGCVPDALGDVEENDLGELGLPTC